MRPGNFCFHHPHIISRHRHTYWPARPRTTCAGTEAILRPARIGVNIFINKNSHRSRTKQMLAANQKPQTTLAATRKLSLEQSECRQTHMKPSAILVRTERTAGPTQAHDDAKQHISQAETCRFASPDSPSGMRRRPACNATAYVLSIYV